ncbi:MULTISPECIES: choline kinase family protein [unclassified Mesorhizobium]|uniref:choline kinase family protein n=1 Tax=unclassified Mesorhizobium TaxID=325217 RepID=UPI00112DE957|nr:MULTISPECIES: choline kinase family protein [unclassified Mesorhizobium]MBZ9811275.1 choline kinase family protein [Mesorhizobium sp. ESP-6-2]TPM25848.1 choline/ethanolamine kinase--aminoglycoside phosphotransferase [Mesorhizobium sp. B2-2-2]
MSAVEKGLGEGNTLAERQLEAALSKVTTWQGRAIRYRPMFGGFSNSNWRISVAGEQGSFFVKLPGPGTERFINRAASLEAGQRAYLLGIGPRCFDYLKDEGIEIYDFVENSRTCVTKDFHIAGVRESTIALYRSFNDSPLLGLTKTVFDMIEEHLEQLAELAGELPLGFSSVHAQYRAARAAIEAAGIDLVPCYNDPAPANFLSTSDGRIVIVDFEYASNNDRCYDLATWCSEMFFDDCMHNEAVEAYFGRVEPAIQARMFVYRMLGDFKWSLWAMIQMAISDIDFDFYKFGAWKRMRLHSTLNDQRWGRSLTSL